MDIDLKKKNYNELLKKGYKPSEALHILENEEKKEQATQAPIPQKTQVQEPRQAPQPKSRYEKIKSVGRKITSKEELKGFGKLFSSAPADIKANLRRNKAAKQGARKAYIRSRKEEISLQKQEMYIRRQEIALSKSRIRPQMKNNDMGMGNIFSSPLQMKPPRMQEMTREKPFSFGFGEKIDNPVDSKNKKKKPVNRDLLGLSGFF